MDVIDSELKRYDSMQMDLENFKKSFDNLNAAAKDQSKSADDLDTLMNEEKPKEVTNWSFRMIPILQAIQIQQNFFSMLPDGTTSPTNSGVETAAKVRKLVESNDEHDFIIAQKPHP